MAFKIKDLLKGWMPIVLKKTQAYKHELSEEQEEQEAARTSLNKWHDARSADEDVLEAWQWDGRSVHDIKKHLQSILQDPNRYPEKIKEWRHTVPEECRGQVFYTASCNPVNSLDDVREYLEIVAIDNSSKEALVCFKTFHTYTDAEGESFVVMPMNEAKALREQFIERGTEEAVEEKSTPQVGAARASSPGM